MLGALKMDDEHLKDFYAGLAMMGWLSAGNSASEDAVKDLAQIAHNVAEAMMQEREVRRGQGDTRDRASV